ncbi:Hypothetical protein I5071_75840 [Sandaracinus amylolyticus]|nr:Hypothetical protein I5071_75840 [Sandaracinus amylolyticus]
MQGRVVERVARFEAHPGSSAALLAWVDDGRTLWCAGHRGPRVLALDVESERATTAVDLGAPGVESFAISPDARAAVIATGSDSLAMWSLTTASWEGPRIASPWVRRTLRWTPDGAGVAYLGERYDAQHLPHYGIGVIDPRTGRGWAHEIDAVTAQLDLVGPGPRFSSTPLAVSPDGRWVELLLAHLDGCSTIRFDRETGVFDRVPWAPRQPELWSCARLAGGAEVVAVARYATASFGEVYRTDLVRCATESSEERWAMKHPGGDTIVIAPDERWFVLWDPTWLQIRSTHDGSLLGRFTLRGGEDRPVSVAIAPGSTRLAVGTTRGRVWVLALAAKARPT